MASAEMNVDASRQSPVASGWRAEVLFEVARVTRAEPRFLSLIEVPRAGLRARPSPPLPPFTREWKWRKHSAEFKLPPVADGTTRLPARRTGSQAGHAASASVANFLSSRALGQILDASGRNTTRRTFSPYIESASASESCFATLTICCCCCCCRSPGPEAHACISLDACPHSTISAKPELWVKTANEHRG